MGDPELMDAAAVRGACAFAEGEPGLCERRPISMAVVVGDDSALAYSEVGRDEGMPST